jgi:hypothetical protein
MTVSEMIGIGFDMSASSMIVTVLSARVPLEPESPEQAERAKRGRKTARRRGSMVIFVEYPAAV